MEVLEIKEQDDGSAIIEVEVTEKEHHDIFEYGFVEALKAGLNMEKPKRVLKLGNIEVDGNQVSFQIVEQSHRGKDFYNGKDNEKQTFMASNGFRLVSILYPSTATHGLEKMYVRGEEKNKDLRVLTTDLKTFTKIVEAVEEYNAK